MSPSHEVGTGSLPGLTIQSPSPVGRRLATPTIPGPRTADHLSVSRVIRTPPDRVFEALVNPWSLLALHAGATTPGFDDIPWHLSAGHYFDFGLRRRGLDLRCTLTTTAVVDGSGLSWSVDYRLGSRLLHSGEQWTVWLERHPRGTWTDLSVGNIAGDTAARPPVSHPAPRLRSTLRRDLAGRLREFDRVLTRYDHPAAAD